MTTKQTIEVEGLPEGRRIIQFQDTTDTPTSQGYLTALCEDGTLWYFASGSWSMFPVIPRSSPVEKIQPRRIVLEETTEDNLKHGINDSWCNQHFCNGLIIAGQPKLWREVKENDLSLPNADPKLSVGDNVRIYDAYRFASILEITGKIIRFGEVNNVCVELYSTNNPAYPIGSPVWVHVKQVEMITKENLLNDEPKLSLSVDECRGLFEGHQPTITKVKEFIKDK